MNTNNQTPPHQPNIIKTLQSFKSDNIILYKRIDTSTNDRTWKSNLYQILIWRMKKYPKNAFQPNFIRSFIFKKRGSCWHLIFSFSYFNTYVGDVLLPCLVFDELSKDHLDIFFVNRISRFKWQISIWIIGRCFIF